MSLTSFVKQEVCMWVIYSQETFDNKKNIYATGQKTIII